MAMNANLVKTGTEEALHDNGVDVHCSSQVLLLVNCWMLLCINDKYTPIRRWVSN